MLLTRAAALLAAVLGFLGTVGCVLGAGAVWGAASHLHQANDQVFAAVDRGLAGARERVIGVQRRVEESKLSADEIGQRVREWAARQAAERMLARLDLENRTDRLAQRLDQANAWLETATEAVGGARQVLETAHGIGLTADENRAAEVMSRLAALQGTLRQSQETVGEIRAVVAKLDDVAAPEDRPARVLRLIARVAATIGEVDRRLGDVADRLTELQGSAAQLQARMSNAIAVSAGVGYFLCAWMAAGQIALCLGGWKYCWRSRKLAPASP